MESGSLNRIETRAYEASAASAGDDGGVNLKRSKLLIALISYPKLHNNSRTMDLNISSPRWYNGPRGLQP